MPKPEFPPFTEVMKDYQEVVSTMEKTNSLFSVWVRRKDNQVLLAFPPGVENRRFFIAMTVASGERYAGLQAGDKILTVDGNELKGMQYDYIVKNLLRGKPGTMVTLEVERGGQTMIFRVLRGRIVLKD